MAPGRKTGGRKKGTPNKISTSVKDALGEAFAQLGDVAGLVKWAKAEPNRGDFYRLWIKMLPQEMKVKLDMDERFAAEVRERLNEVDGGDAGQPGQAGSLESPSVEHPAALAAHQLPSPTDGAG
jgi:hypothetical protein